MKATTPIPRQPSGCEGRTLLEPGARPSSRVPTNESEPVSHEVVINSAMLPTRFVKGLGAVACFVAIQNALAAYLIRRYSLARNGRRMGQCL